MAGKTFRDLEHQGWVAKAAVYRDVLGKVTAQAIDPILNTFGDLSGKRFIDIACGTGDLVAAAAARGAAAEGIDFAATMVAQAVAIHANARIREGDAEHLPYPNGSFDCASCSFGLLHLQNPDKGIAEARRVLAKGGRYTFTVWCTPEQGCDFFRLVLGAVQQHGSFNVPLPPAPPIFRFADFSECKKTLAAVGFTQPVCRIIDLRWLAGDANDVLDLIYKSIVRIPMILQAQTPEARDRIQRAIVDGAEAYRREEAIELKFPAVLVTATRE